MFSSQMVRSQSHLGLVSGDRSAQARGHIVRHDVSVSTGSINRRKLGGIVFKDVKLQRRLNKATHLPIQIQILCTLLYFVMRLTPTVVRPILILEVSGCILCASLGSCACKAAATGLVLLSIAALQP